MFRAFIYLVVFAASMAGERRWVWGQTRPEGSDEKVYALIEQLGNDDYQERERAQAELANYGRDIRHCFDSALQHADPEVRSRALLLLHPVKGEELWQPTMIELEATAQPTTEVFRALARRVMGTVEMRKDSYGFMNPNLTVSCRLPFWQAIDRLCQESYTTATYQLLPRRMPVFVLQAGGNEQYPTAYVGPCRCRLTTVQRSFKEKITYTDLVSRVEHELEFEGIIEWEPHFLITKHQSQPAVVVAASKDETRLLQTKRVTASFIQADQSLRCARFQFRLQPSLASIATLKQLILDWEAETAADWRTLDMDEVTPEREYSQDDITITIQSVTLLSATPRYRLIVLVTRGTPLEEDDEPILREDVFELLDDGGREWEKVLHTHSYTAQRWRHCLEFKSPDGQGQPALLRYNYPCARNRRVLRFSFQDVPLPHLTP